MSLFLKGPTTDMNPPNSPSSGAIAALLQQALSRHQQGRLQEALDMYQQVLAADPHHFQALHGMGILHGQLGHHEEALRLTRRPA